MSELAVSEATEFGRALGLMMCTLIRLTVVGQVTLDHGESRARESCESFSIHVDGQWEIARAKHIDTKIKFLATDEERIGEVSLNDVLLGLQERERARYKRENLSAAAG
jgi:hypothetical protein